MALEYPGFSMGRLDGLSYAIERWHNQETIVLAWRLGSLRSQPKIKAKKVFLKVTASFAASFFAC